MKTPIGTERIRATGRYREWFVLVARRHGVSVWKRKSRLVLAQILGRKLRPTEKTCFIDGDHLNCRADNLMIWPSREVRSCPTCQTRFVTTRRKNQIHCCRLCVRRGNAKGGAA